MAIYPQKHAILTPNSLPRRSLGEGGLPSGLSAIASAAAKAAPACPLWLCVLWHSVAKFMVALGRWRCHCQLVGVFRGTQAHQGEKYTTPKRSKNLKIIGQFRKKRRQKAP